MARALDAKLCAECSAGIFWVTIKATGRPHPVDMLTTWPPMVGQVVVNPRTGWGNTLTKHDVESGNAQMWCASGAEVHVSHYATCPAARADRNPNQEKMDV